MGERVLHSEGAVFIFDHVPDNFVNDHFQQQPLYYIQCFGDHSRKQSRGGTAAQLQQIMATGLYFIQILLSMLGTTRALELQVVGPIPPLLKHPSFCEKSNLWVKSETHPTIQLKAIPSPRYQYIKIGRTFGFETTRYLTFFQNHLFYYDGESDKDPKGYCMMQNVYTQWFHLKNGRFLLYLSNGLQSSVFYFQNNQFWKQTQMKLAKCVIQLNFQENYEMLEAIGKGSFSKVQKVREKGTGKNYAAKIINKKDKNNSPTKALVLEERKILKLIKSPYVYTFEQLYQEQEYFILIIEYLPGKDLMTLWKEKKLTEPAVITNLLRQILEGIKDIHDAGIIHRDLKPQNILINLDTLKPHIIDFGLSLLLDETVTSKSYKRCGTMGYMAPEVIENSGQCKKPYGNKCDLFSFGIIAHMLLLGVNPVKGQNYDQTYLKNKACQIVINKNAVNSKYGDSCFLFLSKLLSKYPQFRFDALQALKSDFMSQKSTQNHDKQQSSSTLEQKNKFFHYSSQKK